MQMFLGLANFIKIEYYSGSNPLNGIQLTWNTDGVYGNIMDRQVISNCNLESSNFKSMCGFYSIHHKS